MNLHSTLILLLFFASLIFGGLLSTNQTNRSPTNSEPPVMEREKALTMEQDRQQRSINVDCQEGNPLGASYSGNMNVTVSGKTCQAWSAQEPHGHNFEEVGEHNHCRNPDGDSRGVWCYTIDPDEQWEYCYVPKCPPTYDCQKGEPLGVTYQGRMNVTKSGRACC